MAPRIAITETELLEAIATSAKGTEPNDAKTTKELEHETGLPGPRILKALHAINAEGRLVVHQVLRRSLDGKLKPTAAYSILPKPKAAKK